MRSNKLRDDDQIYRVDTEPPPPGGDAYGAVTKVGPLSKALVAQMMAVDEPTPQSGVQRGAKEPSRKSGLRTAIRPAPTPDAIPWVGDEDADATLEPTMLNGMEHAARKSLRVETPAMVSIIPMSPPRVDAPATRADNPATVPVVANAVVVPHFLHAPTVNTEVSNASYPTRTSTGAQYVFLGVVVVCALFCAVAFPVVYFLFPR
jgi:hypothetical protein